MLNITKIKFFPECQDAKKIPGCQENAKAFSWYPIKTVRKKYLAYISSFFVTASTMMWHSGKNLIFCLKIFYLKKKKYKINFLL